MAQTGIIIVVVVIVIIIAGGLFALFQFSGSGTTTSSSPSVSVSQSSSIQSHTSSSSTAQASSSSSQSSPQGSNSFLLLTDYTPKGRYAPFYVAQAEGYFTAAGINMKIQSGQGSVSNVALAGQGAADFVEVAPDAIAYGISQGAQVQDVLSLFDLNSEALCTWSINSPLDLTKGNNSWSTAAGSEATLLVPLAVRALGGDPATVKFIPATASVYRTGFVQKNSQFKTVECTTDGDAISPYQVQLGPPGPNTWHEISFSKYIPFIGFQVAARSSLIQSNPAAVQNVVCAIVKGTQFAVANPTQAVNDIIKYNPSLTFNDTLAQWKASAALILQNKTLGVPDSAKITQMLNLINTTPAFNVTKPVTSTQYFNGQFVNSCSSSTSSSKIGGAPPASSPSTGMSVSAQPFATLVLSVVAVLPGAECAKRTVPNKAKERLSVLRAVLGRD